MTIGSREGPSAAYAAVRLEEAGRRLRGTPADAFRTAVRSFLEGPRLDMGRLATQLGISKATLYRWTGPREQLIGEVLSYITERAWDEALLASAELQGRERVMVVYRSFVERVRTFAPLRRFIRNETPLAFRILTMRASPVQQTVTRRVVELLEHECQREALILRAPASDLAYAMTKVTEGFIYSDPVADIEPDIDAAMRIVELLIG